MDLKELPIYIVLAEDYLERALEIGVKYQLAVYDSLYLAFCEDLNFPFIRVDKKQAATLGITLKPITDFTP